LERDTLLSDAAKCLGLPIGNITAEGKFFIVNF